MSKTAHMAILLTENVFPVTDFAPVIILITGKTYSITMPKSTNVSRIPKEYFPLSPIKPTTVILNLEL